ncbi:MAG: hypothetical protein EOP53_27175, partial [Sphingobacteriales bacterium]
MRTIFLTTIALTVFLLSGCKDKDPEPTGNGKLRLKMDVNVAGSPLEINKQYTTPGGQKYDIELLKFYLSNISIIKEDGSKISVKDVVLADLSQPLKEPYDKNAVGTIFTFDVPAASYKMLEFGIGVPKEINTSSNEYTNEHPLSIYRGTDWSWAGYRFIMIQGKAKNTEDVANAFEYHIAGDAFYQTKQIDKKFTVSKDQTEEIMLHLDIN